MSGWSDLGIQHARLSCLCALLVDQLGEVGSAYQPGRLLSAKPEGSTGQHFRRRATSCLVIAETEVLRRDSFEQDIGLPEFSEKPKVGTVHLHITVCCFLEAL